MEEEAVELPQEAILRIFSFLNPKDGWRVCLACKSWSELWQDKLLWKHYYNKVLGGGKPRPPLLPKAWMKGVKEAAQKLRSFSYDKREQYLYAVRSG